MLVEIIGYLGMVIIVLSFLIKDPNKMRMVNSIGCALSIIYGIMTHTLPTALVNIGIFLIDAIFILIESKKEAKK